MKKSIYCVGQKVIFTSAYKGRLTGKVNHIDADGSMYLTLSDNTGQFTKPNDVRVSPIEDFLDPTSFNFHHNRFGMFQGKATNAYESYQNIAEMLEEALASGKAFKGYIDWATKKLEGYAEDYAAAVELREVAEMNLSQWGSGEDGYTLNHHFPFVNPNNLQGY